MKRLYTVTLEERPPGWEPGDDEVPGVIKFQCKVKNIPAFDPEEAVQKATRFFLIQGKKYAKVVSVREQGEEPNAQSHPILT